MSGNPVNPEDPLEMETVADRQNSEGAPLQALIVARTGVQTVPLPEFGELRIGRNPGAEIRIDDLSISRFHAILRVGPALSVEDLGSANGTFVRENEVVPGQRAEIYPGESIRVGHVTIVIQKRT